MISVCTDDKSRPISSEFAMPSLSPNKRKKELKNSDVFLISVMNYPSPIQDSTTSAFQLNCKNAELSFNLVLRYEAIRSNSVSLFYEMKAQTVNFYIDTIRIQALGLSKIKLFATA